MDYYDNLEISMKAFGESAKTAAETISNATLNWDKLSHLAYATDTASVCTNVTSGDLYINDTCLSDYIKNIVEEVNNNNKENNEMMKFDFGPVDSSVHMSMYGMAIKNASGTYVAYDKNTCNLIDVDILNFEGANKFIYKMPVSIKNVNCGDIIIHARKPMFVMAAYANGHFKVLDIFDGEEKTIVPARSPFGFDFVTKVISLFDFSNATADASNPFGNMLPFLLMSDSKSSDKDNLLPLMFMMNGNTDITQNPMMLWALAGNRTNDPMMLAMLMSGFGANPNGCGGNCSCHKEK